jgi:hypothetical protein
VTGAVSDPQGPLEGFAGWQESAARAERSGAGAFLWSPSGGDEVRQGAAAGEGVAEPMGGRNIVWQPRARRGQSSGGAVSAAARTGPRVAAQTGGPRRPLVREPRVAGRRGGLALAACLMAQPWTMVAWARGPRHHTTLPPQRRAGWSADASAGRCPWATTQTRALAAGHCASLRASHCAQGRAAHGRCPGRPRRL